MYSDKNTRNPVLLQSLVSSWHIHHNLVTCCVLMQLQGWDCCLSVATDQWLPALVWWFSFTLDIDHQEHILTSSFYIMVTPSAPVNQDNFDRITLCSEPPPYYEVSKTPRLSIDAQEEMLRRKSQKQSRRKVKQTKILVLSLFLIIFILSVM